jgi:hypothetical protein
MGNSPDVADEQYDWAVLAVTTTLLSTSGHDVADEVAAQGEHITVVYREPGGEWQIVTDPEQPTRYTYLFEDKLRAGTLADYARNWKTALPGTGHITPYVRTWAGVQLNVHTTRLGVEKGWMRYRLAVGAESVEVTFDGRD